MSTTNGSADLIACPQCKGNGWVPLWDEGGLPVTCGVCGGTGTVKA